LPYQPISKPAQTDKWWESIEYENVLDGDIVDAYLKAKSLNYICGEIVGKPVNGQNVEKFVKSRLRKYKIIQ
jgi:hypothetical protein